MTFEEFTNELPIGISGGMIRSSTVDGTHWSVKFWRKYEGSPPGINADDFLFVLRGHIGEDPIQVFRRALPVAKAAIEALNG